MHLFLSQKEFTHVFLSRKRFTRFFCRENDLRTPPGKFLRVGSCHSESSDFLGLWFLTLPSPPGGVNDVNSCFSKEGGEGGGERWFSWIRFDWIKSNPIVPTLSALKTLSIDSIVAHQKKEEVEVDGLDGDSYTSGHTRRRRGQSMLLLIILVPR